MNTYFVPLEMWHGGYYELALEMGTIADEQMYAALYALWTYPALEGCYLDRAVEPIAQPRIAISPELLEQYTIYGLITLPNGKKVACCTHLIRQDHYAWLDLSLPLVALGTAYDVAGFPFDCEQQDHEHWLRPMDAWLEQIGRHVFSYVPFQLGLIGFEVSGETTAANVAVQGIPVERITGYLWPRKQQLLYFSRTT